MYSKSRHHLPVAFMLGQGFDETAIPFLYRSMTAQGQTIQIVSPLSTPLSGFGGMVVLPDFTPDGYIETFCRVPQSILIPGSTSHALRLLQDPRVFDFLVETLKREGIVRAPAEAISAILSADRALISMYRQLETLDIEVPFPFEKPLGRVPVAMFEEVGV